MKKYNILYVTPSYVSSVPDYENARFICNNPPKEAISAGKAIALPKGEFDVVELISQMPNNWAPDVVYISSATPLLCNTPVPKKLDKLNCPSIMKLGDSHHNLSQPTFKPVRRWIEYANLVKCQYNFTTYNRQHIHFYREAGLKNVIWMPGSISIKPYSASNHNFYSRYEEDLLFCGNIETHPYRKGLIDFLKESGFNINTIKCSYTQSLEKYSRAKINFNCSMNGDFNRRIFEVLMAGGFLITDRLTNESGLPLLLKEGLHLECYGSKDELIDKIKYYLENLDKVTAIAKHGNEEFLQKYHPDVMKKSLYNHILQLQELPDSFLVPSKLETSIQFNVTYTDPSRNHQPHLAIEVNKSSLEIEAHDGRIQVYELIQEIHYINIITLKTMIISGQKSNSQILQDLQDLPRLSILNISQLSEIKSLDFHFNIIILEKNIELYEQLKRTPNYIKQLFAMVCDGGLIINFNPMMDRRLQKSKFIRLYSDNISHCSFYFKYTKPWSIKDSGFKLPHYLLKKSIIYRALEKGIKVIQKVIK